MRISTDTALISFEESDAAACDCRHCTTTAQRARAGRVRLRREGRRIDRVVRHACVATTVLAGVSLGAGTASAEPAPSHAGWDGSKYWFKNSGGEWRWTSHNDVYKARTSGSPSVSGSAGSSGSPAVTGIRQGWDGSKYWFKNSSGEWRWTSHHDVYLQRTGGSPSVSAGSSASNAVNGIRQGWDGSKYWFKNSRGQWRWTSHHDVYLQRTGGAASSAGSSPTGSSSVGTGKVESAIGYALAQLGKPYVWGGNGPYGFDCSGLVQQAFRRAGISLPRVADDQYRATTPISSGQLRRGDLIFWSGNGRISGIHHVAVYLGGGKYVEAPRSGLNIRVAGLNKGYYPNFFGRP